MMARMAAMSARSPSIPEMTAAAMRIQTTSSLNWARNFFHSGSGGASERALGPNLA